MRATSRLRSARAFALLLLFAPLFASRAQPGFPPNDPDSWRVAGTAKILCSSIFVSGREEREARAHLTDYFIGAKRDSISNVHIDRQRQLVRLTLANRITREAQLYGDQGCVIHQPGRDSVFFTPVPVTTTLPDASTMPWMIPVSCVGKKPFATSQYRIAVATSVARKTSIVAAR